MTFCKACNQEVGTESSRAGYLPGILLLPAIGWGYLSFASALTKFNVISYLLSDSVARKIVDEDGFAGLDDFFPLSHAIVLAVIAAALYAWKTRYTLCVICKGKV